MAQLGDQQCTFLVSEGLNEAGLGVSSLWDNSVTGYKNYSGTQDAVPRDAISFSVRLRVIHPSPELSTSGLLIIALNKRRMSCPSCWRATSPPRR